MPGKQKWEELRERRGEMFAVRFCKLSRVIFYSISGGGHSYTPYLTELYLIENSLSNSQVTQRKRYLLELWHNRVFSMESTFESGQKRNPLVQRSLPVSMTKFNCIPNCNCQVTEIIQCKSCTCVSEQVCTLCVAKEQHKYILNN